MGSKHTNCKVGKTLFEAGRGDRVADGDGLENRCPCKGTVGSNPTPSAILKLCKSVLSLLIINHLLFPSVSWLPPQNRFASIDFLSECGSL